MNLPAADGRPLLLFNPRAGTRGRRRELLRSVEGAVSAGRARLEITRSAGHARSLACQARELGYPWLIAVGGDGSLQSVAEGLLEARAVGDAAPRLALVPAGRGNDFCRSLSLGTDARAALSLALEGGPASPVDLGRVVVDGAERVFVNACGLGFDGAVAAEARRIPLVGLPAYLAGVFRVLLRRAGPWQVDGEMDRVRIRGRLTLLSLANGASTGGGFRLVPNAETGDGRLDWCRADEMSAAGVLALLPRVLRGTHGGHRRISMGRFERFEGLFEPPIPVHADGEVLSEGARRVAVCVLPAALQIVGLVSGSG